MKKITLNLIVTDTHQNTLPNNVIPCPRIWILKGRMVSGRISITQNDIDQAKYFNKGEYTETFDLEDNEGLKIEAYSWLHQEITFTTDLFVMTKVAGEHRDQIWKSAIIDKEGTYSVAIGIKDIIV